MLFEYMKYYGVGDSLLLVGEPKDCIPVFKEHFNNLIDIDIFGTSGEKGEYYEYDLNKLMSVKKKYSMVFCQAVLEHVCRPSIFVENLVNFTKDRGFITCMSVGPKFGYHAFPIDCVRFFRDFYVDLQRYLPIDLIEYEEDSIDCQFVLYQKRKLDNE